MFRGVLLASLAMAVLGCDRLQQGDRDTPDIVGRVFRSGQPVADASVIVARSFRSVEATCDDRVVSARTDPSGWLVTRSSRRWGASRERIETKDLFLLCIRPAGAAAYDTIFRGMATQWDSLDVECDLARSWLRPDGHGSTGRCLITRYALEGQTLSMRIPRLRALTCDTVTTVITPRGIGPIQLFGDVGELRRLCPRIRDTAFAESFLSTSYPDPRLVIDIAGQPVVFKDVSGLIMDIVVSSPVFRTPDGLRVGMPVSRLAERTDLKALLRRDASGPYVLAWQTNCGIAFGSDRPASDAMLGPGPPSFQCVSYASSLPRCRSAGSTLVPACGITSPRRRQGEMRIPWNPRHIRLRFPLAARSRRLPACYGAA